MKLNIKRKKHPKNSVRSKKSGAQFGNEWTPRRDVYECCNAIRLQRALVNVFSVANGARLVTRVAPLIKVDFWGPCTPSKILQNIYVVVDHSTLNIYFFQLGPSMRTHLKLIFKLENIHFMRMFFSFIVWKNYHKWPLGWFIFPRGTKESITKHKL